METLVFAVFDRQYCIVWPGTLAPWHPGSHRGQRATIGRMHGADLRLFGRQVQNSGTRVTL